MRLSSEEKKFLATYIVESDAIERITRSHEEVLAQIEAGYTKGHVGAYLYLIRELEQGALLSAKMICHVQSLIVSEQEKYGHQPLPKKQVGRWRTVGVSVGGRTCPHSKIVPTLMGHLIGDIQRTQKLLAKVESPRENVYFMATAHYAYLHIHPFADGNGRSSRAINYFLYRLAKLKPFLFTAADRFETYYRCFERPEDMVAYFLARTPRTKS